MIENIVELLHKYQGQQIEFALTFEKEGKTLPQHLEALFKEEFKRDLRKEKEKFIGELEQLILVYNNVVLMGQLTNMRTKLEEEAKN